MQVPHRVAPFTALVRRHPAVSAAAVALGILAGVLLTVFLTGGRSAPRATNVSRNLRACLLDSPANSTDAALTRATWQGLRAAADTGKVNAQRFTAPTVDAKAALPYINGAVQHHCGLIFAVGTGMRPATEAAAKANPRQQFVLVGTTSSHAHVSAITASDDAPGALADKVRKFVSARL